ncbi:MAG TPA: rod-binding protein [Magnetospirillum sp.]|jgi:Rod binding domain-containing protein|nr:rod-binding protein [Magnetospirillum sp.]
MAAASTIAAGTAADLAASAPRQVQTKAASPEKARELGKKFEAMFVTQMLNHMFTGLDAEKSYFGGGQAEAMFRPMLMDEYGKTIANHGRGIGLADQVAKVMLSHQEVSQ